MRVKAFCPGNTEMLTIAVSAKLHNLQYSSEFMCSENGEALIRAIMAATGVNGIHSIHPHEIIVKRSHVHDNAEIMSSVARSVALHLGVPLSSIIYL